MTRIEFLREMSRGLRALPAAARDEILADYQRYFADGAAAGRDEDEVVSSLGNPRRISAELQLGHDVKQWQEGGGARSSWRALKGLSILLALDGLLWLPGLFATLVLLLTLGGGLVAATYGVFTLIVEPFDDPLGGVFAALLRGIGWLAAGTGLLLVSNAGIYGLARLFARATRRTDALDSSKEVLS
jgi:uncharacterized membrane protein